MLELKEKTIEEHKELKSIFDIWQFDYSKLWYQFDWNHFYYIVKWKITILDVRSFIFSPDFWDNYMFLTDIPERDIWSNLQDNLDDPIGYLNALLLNNHFFWFFLIK